MSEPASPRWIGTTSRLWWALVQTNWPAEKREVWMNMPLCVEDARTVARAAGVPLAAMLLPDPTRWQMVKAHWRGFRRRGAP